MPTMKDVARLAQVSLATVSATVSGAAYVSPELKERVNAAIKQLDYARNSIASGLKKGTTSLLGLIVPDITNPFFTELVHAIQQRARLAGYSVLLSDSDQDADREQSLLRLMRTHLAAGTILCPIGSDADYRSWGNDLGAMAVVTVDHSVPVPTFDSILLDNRRAAALATDHLIALGHRRIATFAGPRHLVPGRDRLDGFMQSCQRAGIAVEPSLVRPGFFRQEETYQECRALLDSAVRPTAIFVANNHMLIGVMRAMSDVGLSCPADLSIAAIDDFPWASAFTPALTTVRQPVEAMAEAALETLLDRITGPGRAERSLVFEPDLIVRRSCAAPRSH